MPVVAAAEHQRSTGWELFLCEPGGGVAGRGRDGRRASDRMGFAALPSSPAALVCIMRARSAGVVATLGCDTGCRALPRWRALFTRWTVGFAGTDCFAEMGLRSLIRRSHFLNKPQREGFHVALTHTLQHWWRAPKRTAHARGAIVVTAQPQILFQRSWNCAAARCMGMTSFGFARP